MYPLLIFLKNNEHTHILKYYYYYYIIEKYIFVKLENWVPGSTALKPFLLKANKITTSYTFHSFSYDGEQLEMLRDYFWICTQGIFLEVLRSSYEVPEINPNWLCARQTFYPLYCLSSPLFLFLYTFIFLEEFLYA